MSKDFAVKVLIMRESFGYSLLLLFLWLEEKVLTPKENLCSKLLNISSELLNLCSEQLNISSKLLNIVFY